MQKFYKKDRQKFDELLWNKKKETEVEKRFYKKTEKYLRFIKWIPGLRMIWIGNSISMNSATKNSDIDLFIVTDKNRMWLVRILITLIFQILQVRKTDKKHAWRFCLSFFCEIDWLDFSSFALKKDPYLYFWILYFKPILDFWNTYDLFLEKNSSWACFEEFKDILENNKKYIKYKKQKNKNKLNVTNKIVDKLKIEKQEVKEPYYKKFLNKINKIFKEIFLAKTLKNYKKLWKPYWIIINDKILKFHNWDIRKKVSKKF